ncbi:PP2C family protein-serine/threonine phosphatase [Zoogloea sp.]|uniref:PP2C family protein-serine/threonine phosphatase n=1 Tax=Zoogloea sp. TaxID=49181 RepID=UPI002603FCE9|nr:protein phosphatase 2C domain-containing protein [uncultured Zoogloea sp.]
MKIDGLFSSRSGDNALSGILLEGVRIVGTPPALFFWPEGLGYGGGQVGLWRMATETHVGQVRGRNEDCVFCDEALGIAIVADGMGGHAGGHVAARLAVDAWVAHLRARVAEGEIRERDVQVAVAEANRAVFSMASSDPGLRSMGTTLVAVCLRADGTLLTCHVGDSRIYRWRDEVLTCLTRDHSVLREQCDAGMISSPSRAGAALRGLLTRAVGVAATVVPDLTVSGIHEGDVYLLCSDGLTEMLPDAEIAEVLGALGANPRLAAEHLVDLANDRGGVDNISVVIVSSCTSGRLGAELG